MITEADIWKDSVNEGDKFVLMREGRFRPISETELKLLGITLTQALGRPVSKADRDTLDAVAGPGSGGTVDAVARNLITKVNDLVGDTRAKLRTAGGG